MSDYIKHTMGTVLGTPISLTVVVCAFRKLLINDQRRQLVVALY